MGELWNHVVAAVRHQLGDAAIRDLERLVRGVRQDDERLVIIVDDAIQRDWLVDQYLDLVARALRAQSGDDFEVVVQVDGGPTGPLAGRQRRAKTPRTRPTQQPAANTGLNPRFSFDRYVVGISNQMAASAAQSVAARPGDAYNPLFLYGGVGLGKTHLLHAIGQQIAEDRPSARVAYLSAETFINDFIKAIGAKTMDRFRKHYRSDCDVLLVDDVQFLTGKQASQEEFFHTFEALKNSGRQICLTSDRPPRELAELADRLRSRFDWGLTVDIQPPEIETRIAILHEKARFHGIELPPEVAEFLAAHFRDSVREMEGSLNRLAAFSEFARRPISIGFAREILRDQLPKHRQPTPDDVIEAVAQHFQIKVSDLRSRRRHRQVARPRQVAMYLCRNTLHKSFPEIGRTFGKDHSTVISACRKVDQLIDEDAVVRTAVEILQKRFAAR